MPSNHLILLPSPPSPPALSLFQQQSISPWVGSLLQVAKALELQLQHQSFQWISRADFLQDWLVWSPCSPTDSRESSLAPQYESINSSVLSLLYGPALTSLHDYWKNHNFDSAALCGQVMSLFFNILSRFVRPFFPRSKRLLISWLQSSSAVILTSKKIKSVTGQRMSGIKAWR